MSVGREEIFKDRLSINPADTDQDESPDPVSLIYPLTMQDGSVRREIRFRSPSSNRTKSDDLERSSLHNLRREQTEPSMKYKTKINAETENIFNKNIFSQPQPDKTDKLSCRTNEDNKKTSKKPAEIPRKKTTPPSVFQKDNDKENSLPRSNSYVGSKKPPKPKPVPSLSPRYLQATESSSRYDRIAGI